MPNKIDFKEPLWITAWLDAALRKEQEKYERCPVVPDAVPGHDAAQGWGFVVAGYFLVEESFKALAHVRGKSVPTKHSLTMLFGLLDDADQDVLREYYLDFRATIGGNLARFPFATLDEFLTNLGGDPKPLGDDYLGSFDWRYFSDRERAQPRDANGQRRVPPRGRPRDDRDSRARARRGGRSARLHT